MKCTDSLKKNGEFARVYRRGKSMANKYLVLYKLENGQSINRLGVSVSKKVGKSVVRSRVTRLIKESYRLQEELIESPGWDFIVIARSTASEATYKEIYSALRHLLKKQQVYEVSNKIIKNID